MDGKVLFLFFLYLVECDASLAPNNGAVGNCTSSLAHGQTCQPTCNATFTVSSTTLCTDGNTTPAVCYRNYLLVKWNVNNVRKFAVFLQ